jgi:uncharacterized protein (DUF1330 family)
MPSSCGGGPPHDRRRGRKIDGFAPRPPLALIARESRMAKGYWIARVDVADAEAYKAYVAANAAPIARFGGRFLVRAGKFENPEGASRSRNVVLEFPSYQAALDCYRSPDYQAAVQLRLPVSTVDMVVIEGYEGPQPG